jgi:hypothetical protein
MIVCIFINTIFPRRLSDDGEGLKGDEDEDEDVEVEVFRFSETGGFGARSRASNHCRDRG